MAGEMIDNDVTSLGFSLPCCLPSCPKSRVKMEIEIEIEIGIEIEDGGTTRFGIALNLQLGL